MESKDRSSLFQSECDQSTAKLFESNSNLDSVDVKYGSKQETKIRKRNVKIIQKILEMFDLEETKRKYETQNVVEFVLDPNDFAYDWWVDLTRCMLGNVACFIVCWFFSKLTFSKNSFRNTIRVSNSLDPNQARSWNVGPDTGPNCLQRLSADDAIQKILEMFYLEETKRKYKT